MLIHQRQHAHLEVFKAQKNRDWRLEHTKDLVDVVHVFPNDTVRSTKGAHAHLFDDDLPIAQVCVEKNGVRRAFSIKAQIPEVGDDQSALSCLVEVELHNLWPILRSPVAVNPLDRLW